MCNMKQAAMERAGETGDLTMRRIDDRKAGGELDLDGSTVEALRTIIKAQSGEIATLTAECAVLAEKVGAVDRNAEFTMDQVKAIRDSIKPGDGWDGDNWDFALANAVRAALKSAAPVAQPSAHTTVPEGMRPSDDELWDATLRDRDEYHDMADQLAAQIAAMTEVEIGEHSNMNDPWRNALIAADEFIAAKFKEFIAAHSDKPSQEPSAQVRDAGGLCRDDGRCQYAIDHGAEGLGHCPAGKCCMPVAAAQLPAQGTVTDWISVNDRLPPVEQVVLVYSPPTRHDHPGEVNIRFDCIDPNDDDAASWMGHNDHYEHFCCVAKPEDCIGPSEKAPYTHWHPVPAAPAQQPTDSAAQSGDEGVA